MRSVFALMMALILLTAALPALGEGEASFTMAGCDTSQARRDWSTHLFFTRMEEAVAQESRVRVHFGSFNQFSDPAAFSAWKMGLQPDSEDLPDVLFKAVLSDEETRTLYERGVLIDLRPYITQENMPNLYRLFEDHPEWRAGCTLPDGAIVTLPSIDPIQTNNILWVNRQWLGAVGMEMPATAEDLTALLRAFRDGDANRNGDPGDEIPLAFTGMWDLRWLLHAQGIIMNDYCLVTEDGRVSCPLFTEEMREGVAWLHQLWEEGLLDHAGFSAAEALRRATDENNIPYGMVFGPTVANYMPQSQVDNYEAVMPLTYGGRQVYRSLLGEITRGTFAVTCRCADPAAVLRWVDYLYSEAGCFLARSGERGEEYDISEGTGKWRWKVSESELTVRVHHAASIADDLPVPGYIPVSYQENYDDASVQHQVEQNVALAAIATEACPQVFFTREEAVRLAELWSGLGVSIENQLTWFVTGDEPLNDETWAAFTAGVREQGMDEVAAIWQAAVDRYEEALQ